VRSRGPHVGADKGVNHRLDAGTHRQEAHHFRFLGRPRFFGTGPGNPVFSATSCASTWDTLPSRLSAARCWAVAVVDMVGMKRF
jgi:hypothetical protein